MPKITKEFCASIKQLEALAKLTQTMGRLGHVEMRKRQPSRQTPFVFGQIKNKAGEFSTAIMFKDHTENHFEPERRIINQGVSEDATYSVAYLTAEEAFLLTTFSNVPIYSPVTLVPMKVCLGAIFALMVGQMTTISLKLDDIELAPVAWMAAAMILYPMFYTTWRGLNLCAETAEPVCFSFKTLAVEGALLGLLLVAALGAFVASRKIIPVTPSITDESYLNALVTGSITGAAFDVTRLTMNYFAGRMFIPRNKEAVSQFIGSQLLAAPATFSLLLVLNDLIQRSQGITPEQAGDITKRRNFVPTAANTILGLPAYYKIIEFLLVHGIQWIIGALMRLSSCCGKNGDGASITDGGESGERQPLLGPSTTPSIPTGSPGRPSGVKPTHLRHSPERPPQPLPTLGIDDWGYGDDEQPLYGEAT